ncbi:uncharacterized protein YbbK (DUF523 family) [Sinobacterium caligoides]|uniref:Uncharacterized protein YbbK (DUF523 family) n=1 Tax=Sinobacterium caligoides TaxID=933926 RepID=A0A3N2DZG2_9GAMM|nr:DUF523 domain-containing protein [Sinobacterium caligoides]ROS05261.1 uncharacterized protein YbbK (DUF523 family) [Sinobacterium caligoides]
MIRILVSACLLGEPVRYNGTALNQDHLLLTQWQAEGRLISSCPEVQGGLDTPRPPAEIQGNDGSAVLSGNSRIISNQGEDVTAAFIRGAKDTLQLALDNNVRLAILTERSPSCGSHQIYNGQFQRQLHRGMGVTAALLSQHHIKVFNQHQIDRANAWLKNLQLTQQ